MELSLTQFLIICPLVFLAGLVDAVAGGGGLISLPAYLLAGLPAHNAIATNKVSSAMGTTVATIRYARSGFINWKIALICTVCAFCGAWCGAQLALTLNEDIFKVVMLVLLPLTAAYVLFGKGLKEEQEPYPMSRTIPPAMGAALVIGAYDGFYGPGTGTFLLLLLTGIAHMKITEANGITKVINLTTNLSSLAVYLINGKVILILGLAAGLFNMMGNYIGSTMFTKGGAKVARPAMLAVITIFLVKVIWEMVKG